MELHKTIAFSKSVFQLDPVQRQHSYAMDRVMDMLNVWTPTTLSLVQDTTTQADVMHTREQHAPPRQDGRAEPYQRKLCSLYFMFYDASSVHRTVVLIGMGDDTAFNFNQSYCSTCMHNINIINTVVPIDTNICMYNVILDKEYPEI